MIIDTKGFEIGDEVWIPNLFCIPCKPVKLKIKSFLYDGSSTFVYFCNIGWDKMVFIDCLYRTEQECQLACDRLNGEYHD